MSNTELYKDMIKMFGDAPETQMDAPLAKMCQEWNGEDPVCFLRDLRDLCVHSGSSGFCVVAITSTLVDEPEESKEGAEARRAVLTERYSL